MKHHLATRPLLVVFVVALLACGLVAAFADEAEQRAYPDAQLFINNHRFGESNGCTGAFGGVGSATCGHPGHVSEVSWICLRRSPAGDVYRVMRRYPADAADPSKDTKETTYAGKPLVLWQDDCQKIVLRPLGRKG